MPHGLVVCVDGEPRLTRAELERWSDLVADAIAHAGGAPGPVALCLARGEALPVALLACWKAGRTWLPIDPATPAARLAALLQEAGCTLVLREPGGEPAATPVGCTALDPPAAPGPAMHDAARAWPVPDADAVAYVLFTSGSTGRPKAVAVPHRAVEWYLQGLLEHIGLPPELACGHVSAFAADLGLTGLRPALFDGGCLCIRSDAVARDPLRLAAAHRRQPVDLLKIVPSHLDALLSGAPDPLLLPRRLLVLGGGPARPALLERLRRLAAPTLRVINHYGPTETTVGVATGEWQADSGELRLARRCCSMSPGGRSKPA